jgi:hypothetical protein
MSSLAPTYWVIFEMTSPDQLREAKPPPLPIELHPVDPACPAPLRETYVRVWQSLGGGGRAAWTDEQWTAELTGDDDVYAWTASVDGETVGLLELAVSPVERYAEIVVIGLVPELVGRGFGGPFLTIATKHAWQPPDGQRVGRVGVATLFPEHLNAIPSYVARGFRLVRAEPRT